MQVPGLGQAAVPNPVGLNRSSGSGSAGGSFAQWLGDAFNQANQLSSQADQMAASFAAGGPVSVDQLMVAEQQATLAVDLVVQVRDRAVSAYQSIMNMQV
ncbi:MAG: flagellar hook-basal body complex protein FliE [Alicyclobacillus sp.]|nr:flagellar hook-basal body complex protein FliE [Alicyclobacillus sp.]